MEGLWKPVFPMAESSCYFSPHTQTACWNAPKLSNTFSYRRTNTVFDEAPTWWGVLARLPRNCLLGCCSSSQSPSLETGGNFWDSTTAGKTWQKPTLKYYRACWNIPSSGRWQSQHWSGHCMC